MPGALFWALYMHPIIEFSQHSFDAFSIIISSLLMQTLRHRKAKTLAQSTTAGKGGRKVSDSVVWTEGRSMWFRGMGEPERMSSPGYVRNKEEIRTICQENRTMEQWSQMTSQLFSNSEILWSWHKLQHCLLKPSISLHPWNRDNNRVLTSQCCCN